MLTTESADRPRNAPTGRGLLALFAGCTADGGVQASGRLAWQAIVEAEAALGPARLFCYGDRGPNEPQAGEAVHTDSQWRAVLAALGTPWRSARVLVWHLQLLKLLPLFRLPDARVILFLHGIEAWRSHRWPERCLLRRVDLFLSNSDFTWRRFVHLNPE